MELSVVVPTLNGRERLASCLDALTERAPDAEVVVVNGPSADGTTGMVRDREDVDVLLELSERNVNVARNAGLATASGDVVALLDDDVQVEPDWAEAIRGAVADGADAVTGPTHQELAAGMTTEAQERQEFAGRTVAHFNGGNVAFTRRTLAALDGFDEYLQTGGARDAAHRLAAQDRTVEWAPGMAVHREVGADGGAALRAGPLPPHPPGGAAGSGYARKYRSLAYRLVKNYGVRPYVVPRVLGQAFADAVGGGVDVLRGEESPSRWFASGRAVVSSFAGGVKDGLAARVHDRTGRRNPNGMTSRTDRAVERYDWR